MSNIEVGDIVKANGNYRIVSCTDDNFICVQVIDDRELSIFRHWEVTKPSLEEKVDFLIRMSLDK